MTMAALALWTSLMDLKPLRYPRASMKLEVRLVATMRFHCSRDISASCMSAVIPRPWFKINTCAGRSELRTRKSWETSASEVTFACTSRSFGYFSRRGLREELLVLYCAVTLAPWSLNSVYVQLMTPDVFKLTYQGTAGQFLDQSLHWNLFSLLDIEHSRWARMDLPVTSTCTSCRSRSMLM